MGEFLAFQGVADGILKRSQGVTALADQKTVEVGRWYIQFDNLIVFSRGVYIGV
jgi:hypothetical protein